MNSKQRSNLANINRALIFVLTLIGLMMDGYQIADVPFTLAIIVWLWLPVCTRLEAKLIKEFGKFTLDSNELKNNIKFPIS